MFTENVLPHLVKCFELLFRGDDRTFATDPLPMFCIFGRGANRSSRPSHTRLLSALLIGDSSRAAPLNRAFTRWRWLALVGVAGRSVWEQRGGSSELDISGLLEKLRPYCPPLPTTVRPTRPAEGAAASVAIANRSTLTPPPPGSQELLDQPFQSAESPPPAAVAVEGSAAAAAAVEVPAAAAEASAPEAVVDASA